ncbi:M23 family metallopeptidase [Bengtsoniella intestinalis]|uniref:M23 family metallopeptidase n=1 Tax=Bengtsoniella intestinalis TaxID=3073143 RepID=UPI00391EFDE5
MTTRVQKRKKVGKRVAKQQRHVIQAMICGGLFILLVGLKILIPQSELPETMGEILTHNMDVAAVFSAVGNWGGEEEVMEELQLAVFGEETIEQVDLVDETPEIADEISQESEDTSTLTQVLYSQENLPENVSLEQVMLGFAYQSPITGVVSSPFGYRTDPTEGNNQFHYGVDLAGNTGDPISAFADGTVRAVGESSSYGKYLIIDHIDGYATLYAHCDSIAVSANATVAMGQTIATVGQTGDATGPHLHLELTHNSVYLNPIYYVTTA